MNKLPVYRLAIDELDWETGMNAVSLVEDPAIEVDFLKFEKDKPIQLQFNDEQHIITGPAILADTPIYRINENYGEHYVVFDKELIKKLVVKYSKFCLNNSVNIEHCDYVGGIFMIESYIKDVERGINPTEFSNVPDGSWFVSYKVNDLDLWEKIQRGEVKGYSIEGMFTYDYILNEYSQYKSDKPESFDDYVDRMLKDINDGV